MKIIGLTGGIGSGKSTVAKMFAELGVPVYIADIEAKKLTNSSADIKRKLIDILGEEAYVDGILDKKFVASKIFNDDGLLKKTNSIIHPVVREHFTEWARLQNSSYCIKEAAILFENGNYKDCDATILITAPEKVRIERVMRRDNVLETEVLSRIRSQWPDSKKEKLADFIIKNEDLDLVEKQVLKIHDKLTIASF